MKIFPAIDIKDKKCVRLIKGDFKNKTEYKTSPIDQAGKYKDHGFKNLHIVDLDGALKGRTVNLDIIREIIINYNLKLHDKAMNNNSRIDKVSYINSNNLDSIDISNKNDPQIKGSLEFDSFDPS